VSFSPSKEMLKVVTVKRKRIRVFQVLRAEVPGEAPEGTSFMIVQGRKAGWAGCLGKMRGTARELEPRAAAPFKSATRIL
jgi:hypothetical protein